MPFGGCPCRPVLWRSSAAGRAPECGTLTIELMVVDLSSVQPLHVCGGVEPRGVGVMGLGTLLGPEGSLTCVGGFQCGPMPAPVRGVSGSGYRPCVENFTVDASIFVVTTSY